MIKQAFTQGTLEALHAFNLEKWATDIDARNLNIAPEQTAHPTIKMQDAINFYLAHRILNESPEEKARRQTMQTGMPSMPGRV